MGYTIKTTIKLFMLFLAFQIPYPNCPLTGFGPDNFVADL